MSTTPWRNTVDNTLKSTQDTLDHLRYQQSQYMATSRRVADLFGETDGDTGVRRDLETNFSREIPPPLPPAYKYKGAASTPDVGGLKTPTDRSLHYDPSSSPWKRFNANDANSVPPIIKELSNNYLLAKAQLKNVVVELELERSVRADQIKNMEQRYNNQFSEMKAYVRQLQNDNEYLKNSIRALESQQAFGAGSASLNPARSVEEAKSSFTNTESVAPMLARLVSVESSVARQQQLLNDRHTSMDGVIADLVKNKVEVEVEKVRSIAREAARDSCEDIVKLRMSAIQSMFNNEIQKVLESSGISREIAESTRKTFQGLEDNYTRKLSLLENQISSVQGELKTICRVGDEAIQQEVSESTHRLSTEVAQCRLNTKELQTRLERDMASQIENVKLDVMMDVNRLLKERAREKEPIQEVDVRRMLEESVGSLEDKVQNLQSGYSRFKDSVEGWQKQIKTQLDKNQNDIHSTDDVIQNCQSTIEAHGKQMEALNVDSNQSKQRLKEVETRLKSCESTAEEALQQAEAHHEEVSIRLDGLDAKWKPMRSELDVCTRRAADTHNALLVQEDRLASVESTCATIEQSIIRSTQPIQVKLEAVSQTLRTEIIPKVEKCTESAADLQVQYDQLKSNQSYQEKNTAQQLSDIRKDFDLHRKEYENSVTRDIQQVNQKVLIQKEYLDKKVHSLNGEIKQLWQRTGEGPDTLPTKDQVEAMISAKTEKMQALFTAVDGEIESLQAEVEAIRSADAKEPSAAPSPTAAMSPLKSERLNQLAEEVEQLKEDKRTLEEHVEKSIRDCKDHLQNDLGQRVKQVEENVALQRKEAAERSAEQMQKLNDDLLKEIHRSKTTLQQEQDRLRDALHDSSRISEEDREALKKRLAVLEKKRLTPEEVILSLLDSDESKTQVAVALQPYNKVVNNALEELKANVKAVQAQVNETDNANKTMQYEFQGTTDLITQEQGKINKKLKAIQGDFEKVEDLKRELDTTLQGCVTKWEDQLQKQGTRYEEEIHKLDAKLREEEKSIQTLHGKYTDLEEAFRGTVSPVVSDKLRDVVENLTSEHAITLQPLKTKLKNIEERLNTNEENHNTLFEDVTNRNRDLENKLTQLVKRTQGDVTQYCDEKCNTAALELQAVSEKGDASRKKITALEVEKESMAASIGAMESAIESLRTIVNRAEGERQQFIAAPPSTELVAGLKDRINTLEQLVSEVKDSTGESMEAVADTLEAVTANLQQTVGRVTGQVGLDSDGKQLRSLDDLLVYMMKEIHSIQRTLSVVQQSAIDTVDVLQQVQMEVLPISTLQETLLRLSKGLLVLAEKNGLDEDLFRVEEEQLLLADK